MRDEKLELNYGGDWAKDITAVCPYCGVRFSCYIPDDAIYDDPSLLQDCPECGKKLKFNQFVVDNKGRWH
jgi:predicted  nucleic acid-binding Zn-ribbon protein